MQQVLYVAKIAILPLTVSFNSDQDERVLVRTRRELMIRLILNNNECQIHESFSILAVANTTGEIYRLSTHSPGVLVQYSQCTCLNPH